MGLAPHPEDTVLIGLRPPLPDVMSKTANEQWNTGPLTPEPLPVWEIWGHSQDPIAFPSRLYH